MLFGAGAAGEEMLRELHGLGIEVACFCDNDEKKHGTHYPGVPVIGPARLQSAYRGAVVIISVAGPAASQIHKQLEAMGCFEKIIDYFYRPGEFYDYYGYVKDNAAAFEALYRCLSDDKSREVLIGRINCIITGDLAFPAHLVDADQYFDKDIIRFKNDEVFLDAGAFDGQTSLEFANRAQGYRRILCMEPEEKNYQLLKTNTAGLSRTDVLKKGAWSGKQTLHFQSGGFASHICDGGDMAIEVLSIDEMMQGERVTMIKMDIEGAELEALQGAQNTIRRDEPRLAICVYHKRGDILDIPRYINSLSQDYEIYLRHYGPTVFETVCYAVHKR